MSRSRRWIVVAVVVALLVVFVGPYLYARFSERSTPGPLGLPQTEVSVGPTEEPAPGPLDVDGFWTVAEGSEAGYRVEEVLSGQEVTVVGRTDDVTGSMSVEDGQMYFAEVQVGAATLTTDSASRDDYFRGLLETDIFPVAVFTITDPIDLRALATADGPVAFEAPGVLTIRDVSQPVTATLEAQRSGEGVQVGGAIPVTFADFGIVAPDLTFVRVEESGVVEILLTLERTEQLELPVPLSTLDRGAQEDGDDGDDGGTADTDDGADGG